MLASFSFISGINAQEKKREIPMNTVEVDTIFKKPNPNRLMLGVGFQGELNFNGSNSYSSGVYVHGRYNLGKYFQLGGTFAAPMDKSAGQSPDAKYQQIEGQMTFFFKDKIHNNIKNTGFGKVMEENGEDESGPRREYNAKVIVPNRVQKGVCISAYKYTRSIARGSEDTLLFTATDIQTRSANYTENVYANFTTIGYSFGYLVSSNRKVKYKLYGNIEGEMRSRKARKNGSSDFAFELLYAPSIKFENKAWVKDEYGVQHGYMVDNFKKNNWGARVRVEIRNGIESLRFELGTRPGSGFAFAGDSKITVLNGAYVLIGVGLGFGR